jgi:hypothetical protein
MKTKEERAAYTRAWREAHPEQVAAYAKRGNAKRLIKQATRTDEEREKSRVYQRAWFIATRDKNRQRRLDYNREWKRTHPGACLETRHRKRVRLAGRPMPALCEVCARPPIGKWKQLHFDHDHATGNFRGWLCHGCNTALGLVEDNEDILLNLVEYLRRSRKLRMV